MQLARAALEYLNYQTRQAQEGNALLKVAMMVVRCCLWCFEKCMKFISRNGYIMVAMRGSNFCTGVKDAFALLLANATQVCAARQELAWCVTM